MQRHDGHDALGYSVGVELRRALGAVVGRDLDIERLPLVAVLVAEVAKPKETATRRNKRVRVETAGGSTDRRLLVPVAVSTTELDGLLPDVCRLDAEVVGA